MQSARVSHRQLTHPNRIHIAGGISLLAYGAFAWANQFRFPLPLWVLLDSLTVTWACLGWIWRTPASLKSILLWAILFRLAGLFVTPALEDDHHRYLWDAFVFATQGTPYGQAPAAFFESSDLPEHAASALDGINNPDLPTIYGPADQLLFLAAYWLVPGSLVAIKLLLLVADVGLLLLLRRSLTSAQLLLIAWCPLWIVETAFHGHFDPWPILLAIAAMAASNTNRPHWCGLALAGAVSGRPFALILAPFLFVRTPLSILSFLLGCLLLYAPFLLLGKPEWLGTFALQWEFNSSLYALAQAATSPALARVLCAGLFGAIYLAVFGRWLQKRREPPPCDTLFATLLLCSPVANPWYALWIVPFAAARAGARFIPWPWFLLLCLPLSYLTTGNLTGTANYNHPYWVRPLEFGLFLLAVAWNWGKSHFAAASPAEGDRDGYA